MFYHIEVPFVYSDEINLEEEISLSGIILKKSYVKISHDQTYDTEDYKLARTGYSLRKREDKIELKGPYGFARGIPVRKYISKTYNHNNFEAILDYWLKLKIANITREIEIHNLRHTYLLSDKEDANNIIFVFHKYNIGTKWYSLLEIKFSTGSDVSEKKIRSLQFYIKALKDRKFVLSPMSKNTRFFYEEIKNVL